MTVINKVLSIAKRRDWITTGMIASEFKVSRQYVNRLLRQLVTTKQLLKIGSTRSSIYVIPNKVPRKLLFARYLRTLKNAEIEEHLVLDDVKKKLPLLIKLPENIQSIFDYAFSEMLNNAIEHANSVQIKIEIAIKDGVLYFVINDFGIGVFNSVMKQKKLRSALEAIQEILKGKATTMPKSHSGEGIFFYGAYCGLFYFG